MGMKILKITFKNREVISKEQIIKLLEERTGIKNITYADTIISENGQTESITGHSMCFTDFIFHLNGYDKYVFVDSHNIDLSYFTTILLSILIENGGEKIGGKLEFPTWVNEKWNDIPFWKKWFIKK